METPRKKIAGYELTKALYSSERCSVYEGIHTASNNIVAVKVIPLREVGKDVVEKLKQKNISHKNICQLKEVRADLNNLYLYFEYCNKGSLPIYLDKLGGSMELSDVKYITTEVVKALNYLNSLGIVHGDIKLQSIMLHKKGLKPDIKLADFGTMAIYGKLKSSNKKFEGLKEITNGPLDKIDVWLLGNLLLEMVSGKFLNATTINSKISLPLELLDLLSRSLQVNYDKRISWNKLIMHPFFSTTEINKFTYNDKLGKSNPDGSFNYVLALNTYEVQGSSAQSDVNAAILGKIEGLEKALANKETQYNSKVKEFESKEKEWKAKMVELEKQGANKAQQKELAQKEAQLEAKLNQLRDKELQYKDKIAAKEKTITELIKKIEGIKKEESKDPGSGKDLAYAELRMWLITHKANLDLVHLIRTTDGVPKLISRRNVKKGQMLMYIPEQFFITMREVKSGNATVKRLEQVSLSNEVNSKFTIWCLEEKEKANSAYSPYLKLLFDRVELSPLFYTKEELDLLKGSPALSKS